MKLQLSLLIIFLLVVLSGCKKDNKNGNAICNPAPVAACKLLLEYDSSRLLFRYYNYDAGDRNISRYTIAFASSSSPYTIDRYFFDASSKLDSSVTIDSLSGKLLSAYSYSYSSDCNLESSNYYVADNNNNLGLYSSSTYKYNGVLLIEKDETRTDGSAVEKSYYRIDTFQHYMVVQTVGSGQNGYSHTDSIAFDNHNSAHESTAEGFKNILMLNVVANFTIVPWEPRYISSFTYNSHGFPLSEVDQAYQGGTYNLQFVYDCL